ncbi:CueP family metal-binding protein [Paenibacillus sp. FA6]|uniref:CueP family metal-binding protein n=1 Tax=Paenibacillus sp. FA6 TaxID=3413029 RepID=UPI003F66079A
MRKKVLVATGLVVIALGAYMFAGGVDRKASNETDTQDIKQLVHEYSASNIKNLSASITSQQLIVTEGNIKELTYNLPENEFFISIAPYVKETHPCAIHSLTGCQGEMVEEEFDVYIADMEGNMILDQTMKSQSNGFIDLWLPRDKTYRITVEHDGKTAESEISTFKDDNTCITTMQLIEDKSA